MMTVLQPSPRFLLDAVRWDTYDAFGRLTHDRIAEDIERARESELDAFARVITRTLPATGLGLLKAREREAARRVGR